MAHRRLRRVGDGISQAFAHREISTAKGRQMCSNFHLLAQYATRNQTPDSDSRPCPQSTIVKAEFQISDMDCISY